VFLPGVLHFTPLCPRGGSPEFAARIWGSVLTFFGTHTWLPLLPLSSLLRPTFTYLPRAFCCPAVLSCCFGAVPGRTLLHTPPSAPVLSLRVPPRSVGLSLFIGRAFCPPRCSCCCLGLLRRYGRSPAARLAFVGSALCCPIRHAPLPSFFPAVSLALSTPPLLVPFLRALPAGPPHACVLLSPLPEPEACAPCASAFGARLVSPPPLRSCPRPRAYRCFFLPPLATWPHRQTLQLAPQSSHWFSRHCDPFCRLRFRRPQPSAFGASYPVPRPAVVRSLPPLPHRLRGLALPRLGRCVACTVPPCAVSAIALDTPYRPQACPLPLPRGAPISCPFFDSARVPPPLAVLFLALHLCGSRPCCGRLTRSWHETARRLFSPCHRHRCPISFSPDCAAVLFFGLPQRLSIWVLAAYCPCRSAACVFAAPPSCSSSLSLDLLSLGALVCLACPPFFFFSASLLPHYALHAIHSTFPCSFFSYRASSAGGRRSLSPPPFPLFLPKFNWSLAVAHLISVAGFCRPRGQSMLLLLAGCTSVDASALAVTQTCLPRVSPRALF